MKVAIYARYSTDQQDKTSIAGQVANCEALAAREGLEVVARLHDEGRSGNDDSRPAYQGLLAALKRGDFVGIICDETSRITRNQAELHRLVAELRFRDQFLMTCDGIDTRSETSEIVLSVKAAIDQMEGRKIGYRTYRSLRERHKAGHCAGGRIYGYRIEPDGDYKRRVVIPEQAEIVREIFERYANGEAAKSIARDLNTRAIPSPGTYFKNRIRRANGWTNTTLTGTHTKASGILRNPAYKGVATWNKRKGKKKPGTAQRIQRRRPDSEWIEVSDESMRVVSDATWNCVQARLETQRRSSIGRGRPARYLLSGVLKCGCCGGSYVMADNRNYRCSSHTNGRNALCKQQRVIKRERAEARLLDGIKAELLAPNVVKTIAQCVRSRLRHVKRPKRVTALKADLNRVEKQIGNVVDSLAAVGTSPALAARLQQLEATKAELATQIAFEPAPIQIVPNLEKIIRQRVRTLEQLPRDKLVDPALIDRARAAVHEVLGHVTVIEDGENIVAEVDLGRCYINNGAPGALPALYTKRIRLA